MGKNRLKDKWALITGSTRGIGQQIALDLASEGCNIVVHGRKKENTKDTIKKLENYNVKTLTVAGELLHDEDIDKIANFVIDKIGGVDILYNNAAVMNNANKFWEIPMEEWRSVFQINFFAVVKLCSAFAPIMRKNRYGRIINISSGIADQPDLSPYSATKAAIDKFTKDIAFEYKDDNVLINYLDPGWISTDLGGPNAPNTIDTVSPGVLVPALLKDNGPTGEIFRAQDYKHLIW